jgi:DNA polymerase-3 subunit beta
MGRFAMELIFEKEELWEAMQIVGNVAASRNTLPILANVLIRTVDDQIQLAATDLEVGVKSIVHGQIEEPGSITVPAKKLADIVRELPSTTDSNELTKVRLTTLANDRVEINCENATFRIVGLTDEEFPPLPELGDDFLVLDSSILRRMIQKTSFAVSTEETRHFLNGIYFCVNSDSVTMVATDGKRLAVATSVRSDSQSANQQKAGPVEQDISVIIPTKAVNNILRTFADDGDVKIALLENQIVFAAQNMTLISRLIEGEYPDYEAVIAPARSNEINLVVSTEQLLSVIRRVSLLANPKTPSVRLESTADAPTELSVSASTPELGEAQEQMQVKIEGGSVEIAFNARFVMDVLRNIEASEVIFKFRDSLSPVLVTPLEEDNQEHNYMCVIMPMRL